MVPNPAPHRHQEDAMKAVSRRSISLNSSSTRNSLAYVMRAKRIAAPGTDTRLDKLDTVKKISKCWDAWGKMGTYVHKEYDRLQYVLAFSNNNLHKNPDDIFSIAKGKAVTAGNMWEEADGYSKMAAKYRRRAERLWIDARVYNCSMYKKYAKEYEAEAEEYEAEAQRYYEWASDMERAADYFQYEAENMVEEEKFVSGWESWLDI